MDSKTNPFAPGAGVEPPELAGRQDIVNKAKINMARMANGLSAKGFLLIGLRGVGKTVMLNQVQRMALESGYLAEMVEANDDKSLARLVVPSLRKLVLELDRLKSVNDKVKRALRVISSFVNSVKISIDGYPIGIDVKAEHGVADSGDLETDFSDLIIAVGEAAADRKKVVTLIIDELQYMQLQDLNALLVAFHKIGQKNLPLILLGAGLPSLRGMLGRAKSYAERQFDYPKIGALSPTDAASAIEIPLKNAGVKINEDALSEIVNQTQGYPYFLQEWGSHIWNLANTSPITLENVRDAQSRIISHLDESFFQMRFDRLSLKEKDYLRVMAELRHSTLRSADIAAMLGGKSANLAPLRNGLVKKGMIYSPIHGETAFTVPLFADFMIRIMPYPVLAKSRGRRQNPIKELLKS